MIHVRPKFWLGEDVNKISVKDETFLIVNEHVHRDLSQIWKSKNK